MVKNILNMNILRLTFKEISHRRFAFISTAFVMALCIASFLFSILQSRSFDKETDTILKKQSEETKATLDKLENSIRKQMKGLGFNIFIFPEGQELQEVYSQGYASKTMPEEYVHKLANKKGIVTINHLLPSLTRKFVWPEQKRTIILIGIKGQVPITHYSKKTKKPLIHPVADGESVLGHEIAQQLNLKVGDEITIKGEKFKVGKINEARGSQDDISVWINLDVTQKMFNQEGRINAILALNCNCESIDRLGEVRAEVHSVLPGTEIIEVKSTALARAEARMTAKKTAEKQAEQIATNRALLKDSLKQNSKVINIIALIIAVSITFVLSLNNVKQRRSEIGIYQALGWSAQKISKLILGRLFIIGLFASALGFILTLIATQFFLDKGALSQLKLSETLIILASAPFLTLISGLYPSIKAKNIDPVSALRTDS